MYAETALDPTEHAKAILRSLWSGHLPVPVVNIARQRGVEVFDVFFDKESMDGLCQYNSETQRYEIEVDASASHKRRRFTIAHELGHIELGHVAQSDVKYRDTDLDQGNAYIGYADRTEIEANAFAAELLMPGDMFFHLCIRENYDSYELAQAFQVSKQASYYRGKNLGLWT